MIKDHISLLCVFTIVLHSMQKHSVRMQEIWNYSGSLKELGYSPNNICKLDVHCFRITAFIALQFVLANSFLKLVSVQYLQNSFEY